MSTENEQFAALTKQVDDTHTAVIILAIAVAVLIVVLIVLAVIAHVRINEARSGAVAEVRNVYTRVKSTAEKTVANPVVREAAAAWLRRALAPVLREK